MIRKATPVFVLFFAALRFSSLAAAQVASPVNPVTFQQTQTFGLVGLAAGQTARLNVLSPGLPAPIATGALCAAQLTFLDD